MAKTPETVDKFLTDLAEKLAPLRQADIDKYLQYKKKEVIFGSGVVIMGLRCRRC